MNLSFAILAHNEEKNLPRALESIKDWDTEIVVIDADSTDKTAEIAKKYTDKVFHRPNRPDFDLNKNEAFDQCTRDWIFYLDGDEAMTPELKKEIETTIANPEHAGYWVGRKNMIFGHWMRYGGNYPDWGLRLFRRGKGRFTSSKLHHHLSLDGTTGYLKEPFWHYTYETVEQWITKMNTYTTAEAAELKGNPKRQWQYLLIHPPYKFLRNYIWSGGFRDGLYGFIYAVMNGSYFFFAGTKALIAARKNNQK